MDARPNIALVPVDRDLDVTTVPSVRSTLDQLIGEGCRRIILNMSGAKYVDSSGMGMLFSEIRRMRQLGGLISLTNTSEQVLAILQRARLVDFAPVAGWLDPALKEKSLEPAAQPLWSTVVPIDNHNLAATRACVSRLLARTNLSSDERFDATLAAGEAMGNAVDHAKDSNALVTVKGYADRVVMEISDNGPGFDVAEAEQRPRDAHDERGRGIQLMRLLADSVTIGPRSAGMGTLVRIVKMAHAATD